MKKQWREVKQEFLNALTPKFDRGEAFSIFKLTIESFTGNFPPTEKDLQSNLSQSDQEKVQTILQRVLHDEPIQYILGYAWFYDLCLTVNNSVLIPRQETEELVHWILQTYSPKQHNRILDIGCGSGAIGLALAKYITNSTVIAGDISSKAIAIAQENAKKNEISTIEFMEMDMLHLPKFPQPFDVIVSNPPYVEESFKEKMPKNVLEHEPSIALFAPTGNELIFFDAIADFAKNNLTKGGCLFFEINEYYREELHALIKQKGFSRVEAKKDMNGNWRMLKIQH